MDALRPFHPRLVHFPIALSLAGIAFVFLGFLLPGRFTQDPNKRDRWIGYGQLSLLLGWLGVLAAVASGLMDQSRAPDIPQVTRVINQHITTGIALLVVLGFALYWPLRDKRFWSERRPAYLVLLFVVLILVLLESWLGGKLVYQLGVGVR
jgi:uncharacterized membrane protein